MSEIAPIVARRYSRNKIEFTTAALKKNAGL